MIRRHPLLIEDHPVVVALSGGPDSVALLLALNELAGNFPLELSAAHVNHQLRGEEAEADEQFVRCLCQELNIPLEVKRIDTRRAAQISGENLEDCARTIRYDFLFQLARQKKSRVATGHTLNDQAETFLMKLIRGAGPAGLSGIYPLRVNQIGTRGEQVSVTVVRPLLEITRDEILDYLAERSQTYRVDATNQDLSFDRNWVRHQLIPMLQHKLNPALLETLHRAAGLFREIEQFLGQCGREAFERSKSKKSPETVLQIKKVEELPAIVQKEVVRQAVMESKGDLRDITLRHIGEVLRLTQAPSGKEVHLPGGLKVQREFEDLRFTLESLPGAFSYQLSIPGEVHLREVGKYVVARRAKLGETEAKATVIQWSGNILTVRNRRPGDRYRTSPKSREKKLKELFQKKRIPKSQRDKLIIVEADTEIIWVEGFPPHPKYRATADTTRAVEIKVQNETSDPKKLLKY
ncbi:tRNA lysidine(34) synthetase TilS [Acidobacteria bacterium AH-259-G07]|nr:tRNA lysidine(34) synthetase TilS [Acidobacteria bacterium AH-259-G07]